MLIRKRQGEAESLTPVKLVVAIVLAGTILMALWYVYPGGEGHSCLLQQSRCDSYPSSGSYPNSSGDSQSYGNPNSTDYSGPRCPNGDAPFFLHSDGSPAC